MLLEHQKDGWKIFPSWAGEWLARLCCFSRGSVFEEIQELKESFGPHVVFFLCMLLVSGKVVCCFGWFFLNACSYFAGIYLTIVSGF